MRTLDHALKEATGALQSEVDALPDKAWRGPSRRQFGGPLVALIAAAAVLVVVGVPALLHNAGESAGKQPSAAAVTSPTIASSSTTTVPKSDVAAIGTTVYVLDVPDMTLEDAEIHHEPDGTAFTFSWTGGVGQRVSITTFQPFMPDSPKAEDIGTVSPDATFTSRLQLGATEVEHSYHQEVDIHTMIWWDSSSVTRLTAYGYGPATPPLLDSIVAYDAANPLIGELVLPEDIGALIGEGEEPLAWGVSGGTPWVLVGWELTATDKPTLPCTGVRPVHDEDVCTGLDESFGWIAPPRAFALDDGGVVVLYTQVGVARILVNIDGVTETVTVFGEADGYPPTAVFDTGGSTFAGSMTPLDSDGQPLSESIPFVVNDYVRTPAGG